MFHLKIYRGCILAYLGVKVFSALLKPFSNSTRKRRMALFVKLMKPMPAMKILDLGGQPAIWDFINTPLNITCLNLPSIATVEHTTHHQITYVEGDACSMPHYAFGDFDLVFSNSVIEHVGCHEKRLQFANEVLRLSSKYWIQTPSKYYPIEAHCGMPLWWFYPQSLRSYFISKWKKKLPDWTEMVETTTFVSSSELQNIFPSSTIKYEWVLFPKSLIAYSSM